MSRPIRNIEGYTLTRMIGTGGTSEVWEANDEDYNNYAIKVFNTDPESYKTYQNQSEICRLLNHEHLVTPKSRGEIDGRPYLVFDFYSTSLMKLISEKKAARAILGDLNVNLFSEEEIAGLLLHTASALECLHENKIIHRDLKPDNILIEKRGSGRNRYAISDFGASSDLKLTVSKSNNSVMNADLGLTPEYASPEQIDGKEHYHSDIFSLGITLYEACTGELPFVRSNAAQMIKNGNPVTNLPDGYSSRLNELIHSCLSLRPEMRPTAKTLKEKAVFFIENGYWQGNTKGPGIIIGKRAKMIFSIVAVLGLAIPVFMYLLPKKVQIYQNNNGQYGLKVGSEQVTPAVYDQIIPFFTAEVITVREGNYCRWINDKGESLLDGHTCKLCKVYKSLEEFQKDISNIKKCKK